jgi:hypothetical protein
LKLEFCADRGVTAANAAMANVRSDLCEFKAYLFFGEVGESVVCTLAVRRFK